MRKRLIVVLSALLLLVAAAFVAKDYFGIGSSGVQFATGSNGQAVTEHQHTFSGNLYLTVGGNPYVLNGADGTAHELVNTGNVMDPAVSPDGRWVASIEKYQNYSDLCVLPTTGGKPRVLRSGNESFYNQGGFIHNTYVWYAQPAWSPDGSTLLFLSDLEKEDWYRQTGQNAPLLDLQAFRVPLATPQ